MEAKLKTQDGILRDDWNALVQGSPQGNFYALTYYMDVVAPDWMGIEVLEKQELVAVMPILIKKKAGLTYALQPPFTQFWGLFFEGRNFPDAYREYSWKKKVVDLVVAALPEKLRLFQFGFAPEFDYPIPFHWAGFTLQTRYTYQLDLKTGAEALWRGIKKSRKSLIRQAEKAHPDLQVTRDPAGLIQLIEENAAQGKEIMSPVHLALVPKIISEMREEGYILEIRDDQKQVQAAAYFVDFKEKTTYLIGVQKPDLEDNGLPALLLWKAIQKSLPNQEVFDFEGSMLPGVESFFRTFGGRPVPYLFLAKNDLPLWLRWIRKLRS